MRQAHLHGDTWLRCAGNELPVHDHSAERQSVRVLRKEPDEAVECGREDDEGHTEQFSDHSQVLRSERTRFALTLVGSNPPADMCLLQDL